MKPIGILYEHPLWFEPLFAELDRRGVPYERVLATSHTFDPSEQESPYALVVNRVSPSAWLRGNGEAIFWASHYLAHLDEIGADVINGYRSFAIEISKARQLTLFSVLGIRHPHSRVINDADQAVKAARSLSYPVMVKPNVGGSGAGISSYDDEDQLGAAVAQGELDFGPDGTAIVQEHLPAADEAVVRIEILDGKLLYAIRLLLLPGSFNLCPADYCDLPGIADGVSGRGLPVEAFEPPAELAADAARILDAAGADIGGVEYLVNARDSLPYVYDVNTLSNFVADAPTVVGFDPFVDFVDYLVARSTT